MSATVIPETIPETILEAIYRHARQEFPRECCGYLVGEGATMQLTRCTNQQDQLHELDPQAHARTSENAYDIGGKQLLDLVRSFDGDRPATVIYHSHPRVGAYFSDEDVRAALLAGYPVDYLVVDAQDAEIKEAILFRRQGDVFAPVAGYSGQKL